MGNATQMCLFEGALISIERAIEIRDMRKEAGSASALFFCVECGEPVRPLRARASGGVAAHFQHVRRSRLCKLSPENYRATFKDIEAVKSSGDLRPGRAVVPQPLAERLEGRSAQFLEGATRVLVLNEYERNPDARLACLRHHGYACSVCGFDFEAVYGECARGFIHVHHLVPLSLIGSAYLVDPIADLIPVCPNCHAVMHLGGQLRTVEEVKSLMREARAG
ncbi:HNH endonuclease [Uliginosibacterium sediminicola]|uniref:HNH endonuclease n=1 Tax=Uliginosibacterium sediminicola TaxID=2024550 RepID=A0ABU9YX56_9RHOO